MDHPWTSKQVCQGGLKYELSGGGGIRGEGGLSITHRRRGLSKYKTAKSKYQTYFEQVSLAWAEGVSQQYMLKRNAHILQ